jgi:hypothetical protein
MPAILAAVARTRGGAENGKNRTAQYDIARSAMTGSSNDRKVAGIEIQSMNWRFRPEAESEFFTASLSAAVHHQPDRTIGIPGVFSNIRPVLTGEIYSCLYFFKANRIMREAP